MISQPRRELPAFLEQRPRRDVASTPPTPSAPTGRIPGEAGLWVFLLGDMSLFGLFFVVFAAQMSADPAAWAEDAARLHDGWGMTNTVLLLVSSYLMARAVACLPGNRPRARAFTLAASALGVGFVVIKTVEYTLLVHEGISPVSSIFFTYYFVLTGIHLLHVLIGVAVLLYCARRLTFASARSAEGSAAYWHMVDILWVVLFPLLYLVGRG